MRLSQIKIAGFKSFVDPTVIPTPGNLIGIVGPNGCGKSNVIDAVRWVLGESKASALRGDSMQDVIFSGSVERKPVGRASVELIFDNTQGSASGQWSSYAEIAIKRIIQRDGNSTYYINNTHVRRRDITDIFLGTGIGGRGYAIIEQGMISRIIEAKPQELKVFLEEAAGISKYQERRHETELRLSDTRKNLLRIEDLYQELELQIKHLGNQAQVAQQFTELQEKVRTTQNILWLLRKQAATAQRTRAEKKIQQLEQTRKTESDRLQQAETELEQARIQEHVANDTVHQKQGELYTINAEIARVEQEIQHITQNRERLSQQLSDTENQLTQNQDKKTTTIALLEKWQTEEETARTKHETCAQSNQIENEKLPEIEKKSLAQQESLDNCKRKLLLLEQATQLAESHHDHATKTIQQLESRRDRLQQEQATLPPQDDAILNGLQNDLEQANTTLTQNKALLSETEEQLATALNELEKTRHNVQTLQQVSTQLKARHDALQALQLKIENNEALSNWLSQHQFDALPRLWQKIQIDQDWENALEAVLRERLNSTGFEQLEVIQDWQNDTPPGKWTLFETTQQASLDTTGTPTDTPAHTGSWTMLTHCITCHDSKIQMILDTWLCNIFIADNIKEGLSRRAQLPHDATLVTREGHIFTRHSLTYYTPDSQLHGVLSRQQELNEINAEMTQQSSQLNEQQSQLEQIKQVCQTYTDTLKSLRQQNDAQQQQYHQLQLEINKQSQLAEQMNLRRKQIDDELEEIKAQIATEITQQQSETEKLADHEVQIDTLRQETTQAQSIWESTNQLLATQRQLVQQSLQDLQEAAFYVETCQNKISETKQALQVINEQNERLTTQQNKLVAEQSTLDQAPISTQLQTSMSQRSTMEFEITAARENLENTSNQLQEIEHLRLTTEQTLHTLQESVNQTQLAEQEARMTENQFDEQLRQTNANEKELLPLINNQKPAGLQADIQRFNDKITSLGAVNLAALEELEASQTRKTELDLQLQDLNEAIATLENVIKQIDRETQERLQETFDTVNENLSELFPIIFAGGQAKLILSDGAILDSGIVLTAQPPGKKNSSIHLLSGGEKALTALALVFSLFKLNPAPFCLLDEVDAPLDDSNTNRFCDLVKRMSKQTQFLFISHNKITMELAQQLIGVTMQEQGVSRVVAVDIADAIRLENQNNVAV